VKLEEQICVRKKEDWKRKGNRKINRRKEEEEINVENIIEMSFIC
jgi:hypothetical protein